MTTPAPSDRQRCDALTAERAELKRIRPAEIATKLGVTATTVYNAIRAARAAGLDIPHFSTGPAAQDSDPRPHHVVAPVVAPEAFREPAIVRPIPAPAAADASGWTAADDDRLRELLGRGGKLTTIAAMMRKPYRLITEAAERLGLFEARSQERAST